MEKIKSRWARLGWIILFFPLLCFGDIARSVDQVKTRYESYLQWGGSGYFNKDSHFALEYNLFLPLVQTEEGNHLFFNQLRMFDRNGKSFEGNLHLGYRYYEPSQEWLYGLYAGYDRKRSSHGNYFNQLMFGVENWRKSLFLGGNVYLPVGTNARELSEAEVSASYDRGNIWLEVEKQRELALGGGDIELGYELKEGLIGYIGGYYFAGQGSRIRGPRIRLNYEWFPHLKRPGILDKLGLEVGIQRDEVRGTVYSFSINARFGLAMNYLKRQGVIKHMGDLLRRDPDIVSARVKNNERKLYRDSEGRVFKVEEISDEESWNRALNSEEVGAVWVKTSLTKLDKLPKSMIRPKVLVFGDQLKIRTNSGKLLKVDLWKNKDPARMRSYGSLSEEVLEQLNAGRDKGFILFADTLLEIRQYVTKYYQYSHQENHEIENGFCVVQEKENDTVTEFHLDSSVNFPDKDESIKEKMSSMIKSWIYRFKLRNI